MATIEEMIAEKLGSGGGSGDKNIDKAIELLGNAEKVIEFSFIDGEEKRKLFRLGVKDIVFFKERDKDEDDNMIQEVIDLYCKLSKSVDGKSLEMIRDIFKTEIGMDGLEKLKQI